MKMTISMPVIATLFLITLLFAPTSLLATDTVRTGDVRPLQPSSVDPVTLVVGSPHCPQWIPAPERPPEITITSQSEVGGWDGGAKTYYDVDYYLERLSDETPFCPGPVPPEPLLLPLGTLPVGTHAFRVITHRGGGDGEGAVEQQDVTLLVTDHPGESISGPWYSQRQSGRGLFINRYTTQSGGDEFRQYAVYWATHDVDGEPIWVVAQGDFSDNRFESDAYLTRGAPLAPGDAALDLVHWGRLILDYQGCGSILLSWEADDARIADGSEPQVQLARPDGATSCAPEGVANTLQMAVWAN